MINMGWFVVYFFFTFSENQNLLQIMKCVCFKSVMNLCEFGLFQLSSLEVDLFS